MAGVTSIQGDEMNTTMITSSTADPIAIERLAHYNPEVEQRVQQWLASG